MPLLIHVNHTGTVEVVFVCAAPPPPRAIGRAYNAKTASLVSPAQLVSKSAKVGFVTPAVGMESAARASSGMVVAVASATAFVDTGTGFSATFALKDTSGPLVFKPALEPPPRMASLVTDEAHVLRLVTECVHAKITGEVREAVPIVTLPITVTDAQKSAPGRLQLVP